MTRVQGEATSTGHRRITAGLAEHSGERDGALFKREIASKLDAFSLADISKATG